MKTVFEEFLQQAQKAKQDYQGPAMQAVRAKLVTQIAQRHIAQNATKQNNSQQSPLKHPDFKKIAKELKQRNTPIAVIILIRFFEVLKKYLELPMIIIFPILLAVVVLLKLIA